MRRLRCRHTLPRLPTVVTHYDGVSDRVTVILSGLAHEKLLSRQASAVSAPVSAHLQTNPGRGDLARKSADAPQADLLTPPDPSPFPPVAR